MNCGIKNRKAFVTGGATGIGKAIAIALAKEGASIVVTSRDQKRIDQTLSELKNASDTKHFGIVCDLNSENEPKSAFKKISNDFGEIDILVNNIGSNLGITDPYCSIDDWRKVFRINFELAVELNNLFIPNMKKKNDCT